MDAGKRTINDIFNGSRVLEIPFFQRAYVWGEEQWERLLEDIDNVCRSNEPYFMGSVILKQQQTSTRSCYGDIRTIIDGQQRLTTLSILLKVLCLKTEKMNQFDKRFRLDDGTTVLKHNHNDIESYTAIMNLISEESIEKNDSISAAYRYFCENLHADTISFDAVANKMLFVAIDLSPEEDEQQIFDAINSLGVKLTTAELLKNYFFNRDDLQAYETYWKSVFEQDEDTKAYWDREITAGRFRRSFIDLFFYSYLQIKLQDVSLSVKTEDKILFSKVDKLFESYKKFIERYYDGDKSILRAEIRDYANLFKKIFDPEVVNNELPAKAGLERLNAIIFALETTTLIPYILFVERNVNDHVVKTELYEFIESYIMRRLLTRASTKNYNQLFTDRLILNRILSKQEFLDFLENQDDRVNYLPSDTQVRDAINSYVLTNKQATGVLYFIESKIRDRTRHSTQLLGMNKYSLEHIMPKKWINHWEAPTEHALIDERHRKLLTLGNLTIITQALNASIRDADWETKKAGRGADKAGLKKYAEGIDTFSDFMCKKIWDEAAIAERAEFLHNNAIEVWDAPNTENWGTNKNHNENWNGEHYFCYGAGESRSWDDAVKYGFISAGGGHWYTKTMLNLEIGSRVWVYIPDAGYVGVGTVSAIARPAREAILLIDGKEVNFYDLPLQGNYHKDLSKEQEEYIVCIDWIKTVLQSDAVSEREFFSNQNTVARPTADSWSFTIERLTELWELFPQQTETKPDAEKRFNSDMQQIYIRAKKELKYNPSRFIQLVSEKGGLSAAKELIAKDGGTYGIEVLWEHKRLDLSVEAHVLKPEYRELFCDKEIEICRNRLMEFGFEITD